MAKKKLRETDEAGELNLLPIMNMICLLIPFLLMAAQFVKIGVVLIETPRLSRAPTNATPQKEALGLTLVMTDQGIYLKSRHGGECPAGVAESSRLCFRREGGQLTQGVLTKLQGHLWTLFARKYKDESNYAVPADRHAITVVPEPTVRYEDIVRVLDTIREVPANAKDPPLAQPVPPGGCTLVHDQKGGGWGFSQSGGVSVQDTACMYHRVTLALGSS